MENFGHGFRVPLQSFSFYPCQNQMHLHTSLGPGVLYNTEWGLRKFKSELINERKNRQFHRNLAPAPTLNSSVFGLASHFLTPTPEPWAWVGRTGRELTEQHWSELIALDFCQITYRNRWVQGISVHSVSALFPPKFEAVPLGRERRLNPKLRWRPTPSKQSNLASTWWISMP